MKIEDVEDFVNDLLVEFKYVPNKISIAIP